MYLLLAHPVLDCPLDRRLLRHPGFGVSHILCSTVHWTGGFYFAPRENARLVCVLIYPKQMKRRNRRAVVSMGVTIWAAVACVSLQAWKVTVAASCGVPTQLHYQVVRQVHRSEPGFTEGLIYRNGLLFESTGGYGSSGLNQINPVTGRVQSLGKLSQDLFGEGLEFDGQTFYQLSWKEHQLIEWDLNGRLKRTISYPYEGWGLTRGLNGVWISSDGTNSLYFFDRAPHGSGDGPWSSQFKLSVMNGPKAETKLNELEFARGSVYANVFQESRIVQIDPANGCVSGELDLSGLIKVASIDFQASPESVLNGIAYRSETDTFFITGKNWPTIYEVRIFA